MAAQAHLQERPERSARAHRDDRLPAFWPHRDRSRWVRIDGVAFHLQEWPGPGPTILLVHGTGASTHSFAALAPLLAAHAHVIAVDLPGHGYSETSRTDLFTLPGMALALGHLLKAEAIAPTLAVGHSAGAAILIRLALDGTITPDAIVALNGAILPLHPFSHPLVSMMAKVLAANPFVPWFFSKQADEATVGRLLRDTGSKVPAESRACYEALLRSRRHVASALRMMAYWDLEPIARDLPQLAAKLVLIVGNADKTIPPHSSVEVAQRAPNTALFRLPQLGHLAHEEHPQSIADLILSLLPATPQKAGAS